MTYLLRNILSPVNCVSKLHVKYISVATTQFKSKITHFGFKDVGEDEKSERGKVHRDTIYLSSLLSKVDFGKIVSMLLEL